MKNSMIVEEVYENLPIAIKNVTDRFKGRERDMVLLSLIGALSSCFPKLHGIYDGKIVYPNLYVMVIAPPASGKGVMTYALEVLKPIHEQVFNASLNNLQDCEDAMKSKRNKKGKNEDCPPLEMKIIPGNISAAEMYSTIKNAHFGGVIIESEADTLSLMLNQDWGNFSDVLRKAFHHERISISRKIERLHLDIPEPQLSLVLSGTPNQLQPLVKTQENGLFSRMIFYYFKDSAGWKSPFLKENKNMKTEFQALGNQIYEIYGALGLKENFIEFQFTREQEDRFNEEMENIHSIVLQDYPEAFSSTVKRHGLIFFRLCMIFSALRNEKGLKDLETVTCSDTDFETVLTLVKQLLYHAEAVSQDVNMGFLSENDDLFLFNLKETFTRREAIDLGKTLEMSERSVDEKLKKWRFSNILKKLSHGKYKRMIG